MCLIKLNAEVFRFKGRCSRSRQAGKPNSSFWGRKRHLPVKEVTPVYLSLKLVHPKSLAWRGMEFDGESKKCNRRALCRIELQFSLPLSQERALRRVG